MNEPARDCALCPRLAEFREQNRLDHPSWRNAPVPSFGARDVRLLIVGLAPGLKGANRTGRPFTGDYAGDLLYPTLIRFGLAHGRYQADAGDGLRLSQTRITNALRCVPPKNKPLGAELAACRPFLRDEIARLPRLKVILALGRVAHDAVLTTLGHRKSAHSFAHDAVHELETSPPLIDSYHCSRYNTNTGRLTESMFHAVFETVAARLKS